MRHGEDDALSYVHPDLVVWRKSKSTVNDDEAIVTIFFGAAADEQVDAAGFTLERKAIVTMSLLPTR